MVTVGAQSGWIDYQETSLRQDGVRMLMHLIPSLRS